MTESKARVLITAAVVCFVCSVLVSVSAVALKPLQQQARELDRKRNILDVLGLYQPGMDVDQAFAQLTPVAIELDSGTATDAVDAARFDMFAAAKKPGTGTPIPDGEDIASINFRPRYATVYLLYGEDGRVRNAVLPVQGYGLWSTMYAFLALEGDANTVRGINFYQQAETPGLGGEVTNPAWRALWRGKQVYDAEGAVQLHLVKGNVDPASPQALHQVDALSGATLTSNGVSALVTYWLSDAAYRPFLQRLATGDFTRLPPGAAS